MLRVSHLYKVGFPVDLRTSSKLESSLEDFSLPLTSLGGQLKVDCQVFSAQNCSVFVLRSKTYFDQEAKACTDHELAHDAPAQCKLAAISCDLTAR